MMNIALRWRFPDIVHVTITGMETTSHQKIASAHHHETTISLWRRTSNYMIDDSDYTSDNMSEDSDVMSFIEPDEN